MKLNIDREVYGGSGIAHTKKGETIFVPFTLPGELVEVRLTGAKQPLQAEIINVIQPATSRIAPQCIHFGVCGGCHYQHAAYDAQCTMKLDILSETLERAGLRNLPSISTHSSEPWHYRNRIRLQVRSIDARNIDGVIHIGYSKRGSNEFLPITMYPIAAPAIWDTAQAIIALAQSDPAVHAWLAVTEEMEIFSAADGSRIQLSLFLNQPPKARRGTRPIKKHHQDFRGLCQKINTVAPIAGAGTFIRKGPRISPDEKWGTDGLLYQAASQNYWVSRGGFFQVNRFLVDKLVQLVTEGRSGKLAWDLYAGVGLFSRQLVDRFQSITAVESGEPAATDLRAMLGKLGPQHRALSSATVDFLRTAVLQRDRPDLIVTDPPRAGLGASVTALLARIAAPQLVHISCDPATLGRDLRALVDSGYHIEALHLIDLFPQTFHLETVVMLRQ